MFLLGDTNGISMRLKEKTPGTIEHVELSLQMQPKQENTATFCTYCVIENKKELLCYGYTFLPKFQGRLCAAWSTPPPLMHRLCASFMAIKRKPEDLNTTYKILEAVITPAVLYLPLNEIICRKGLLTFIQAPSELTSIVRQRHFQCFQLLLH